MELQKRLAALRLTFGPEPNSTKDDLLQALKTVEDECTRWRAPTPSFSLRLRRIADNAIAESVQTFLFILFLAGLRWLADYLFGQSKFFDFFPVRYFFDAGDIAVLGRFIWNNLKGGK